jgi:rRNA maturation endonuclease Nob1
MAEVVPVMMIAGSVLLLVRMRDLRKKIKESRKRIEELRELRASAPAKAYADRQEKIILKQMMEEAMNELTIYEQEVINEVLQKIENDNRENRLIELEIKRKNYKIMMENTREYKDMMLKYKI